MAAEDLLLDVMSGTNDLGFFIAAYELMIEDPDYQGVRANVQNQLEFLKYMNRNGCKTHQDLFKRLSDRAVDPKMVKDFASDRENYFTDALREGYPELFLKKFNLN